MNSNERKAAALERLFRTYPSFQGEGDNPNAVLMDRVAKAKVYFEAIEEYEPRDVEEAVHRFLTGRVAGHNPAFLPPAPQVGVAVRAVMNERLDAEARQRLTQPRLPPPDVQKSPESRERVKGMVADLVMKLANAQLTDDAKAAESRQERQAAVNEFFRDEREATPMKQRLHLEPYQPIASDFADGAVQED